MHPPFILSKSITLGERTHSLVAACFSLILRSSAGTIKPVLLCLQAEHKVNFRGGVIAHKVNEKTRLDVNLPHGGVNVTRGCLSRKIFQLLQNKPRESEGFMSLLHKSTRTRGTRREAGGK